MSNQVLSYLVPVLAMGIIVWRLSRQQKGRPVKPSRLWIRPAILLLLLGLVALHPPKLTPLTLGVLLGAAAAGIVVGYVMASHQALTIDPDTGKITSRMSPVGMILFLGLFVARYAFRIVFTGGQAPDRLAAHSDQILLYTDAGLLFVLAMVSAQSWEIWRRTRPLLAEHAARQAAAKAD